MSRSKGENVSRLVTHHLSDDVIPERAERLAILLSENELNVSKTAEACGAQPRAVRRWIKVAFERGQDVLEIARGKLKARGIDPASLPAEKVRDGMEGARKKMSDRSDTSSSRGRGRPRKVNREKN